MPCESVPKWVITDVKVKIAEGKDVPTIARETALREEQVEHAMAHILDENKLNVKRKKVAVATGEVQSAYA